MVCEACYRITTASGIDVDVFVNEGEHDELTLAIRNNTFSFPRGFQLLPDLVPSGSRVLDLGAHIGLFSLFAAASGYHVASVEASPANSQLLTQGVKHNGFSNVQVLNLAVSDRIESVEFVQAGPYGFVSNPYTHDPTISVSAISVDELLARIQWDRVAFIKMDIEGSEVKALRGMYHLLSRDDSPFILYESNGHTLHLFGETPNSLMSLLEQYGYRCYLVQPGLLTPVQSGDLQPECTVDYLAVKQPLGRLNKWRVQNPCLINKYDPDFCLPVLTLMNISVCTVDARLLRLTLCYL
ncbi:MAG: FkbM family methyltransferase [Caldilineaceae bacterium]|nr:FkbM family methyltransferase [Caldilineaceae bacterium]